MQYLYYEFEAIEYWFEIDDQLYARRQIVKHPNGDVLISCRDACLAEKAMAIDSDNDTILTAEQFEAVWQNHSRSYRLQWKASKAQYPVGCSIAGVIKYFYPQGIIVSVGAIQAVAHYQETKAHSDWACLYPGGYDEQNMWLIVENGKAV